MNDLREAAIDLMTTVQFAIKSGDWKVDGACDPTLDIERLRQALAHPDLAKVGEVGVWGDKREWVGLTDEEIYDYADKFLYQHGSNYGIKSFGKAIEAKLKEKNT